MEINALIETEALLSPKRLGMVCVILVDSSPHGKARAQACYTCRACVEKTGLASFGRKGVLSAAKLLSQETSLCRVPALDLMEMILSKMNGDVQRLVRICGPNLSDKSRLLLEERWHKGQAKESSPSSVAMGSPTRRSQNGSPRKTPLNGYLSDRKQPDIFDELPRLSLRTRGKEPNKTSPRIMGATHDTPDDPFAFSFSSLRGATPLYPEPDRTAKAGTGHHFGSALSSALEPSGAAAALRARLSKIRENSKISDDGINANDQGFAQSENGEYPEDIEGKAFGSDVDFGIHMDSIRCLLDKDEPMGESHLDLEGCVTSLKIFHAALSRQQHSAVGLTAAQISGMRVCLVGNMNELVGVLRRYAFIMPSIASTAFLF